VRDIDGTMGVLRDMNVRDLALYSGDEAGKPPHVFLSARNRQVPIRIGEIDLRVDQEEMNRSGCHD